MNRRDFFKTTVVGFGAVTFLSALARAEGRGGSGSAPAAAAKPVLVDPKSPDAKAVNYVHVNTEIKDKALKNERSGVKFENQKCKGCVFYGLDKETTVGGKKASSCQMPFAKDKVVSAEGWCSSWAKR